jgi:hypothetical protein
MKNVKNSIMRKYPIYSLVRFRRWKELISFGCITLLGLSCSLIHRTAKDSDHAIRECISLNENWHFYKYDSDAETDNLIFPDWHEQDLRAFIHRDRNHPSVIIWSFGNEVGEQYTGANGAVVAKRLHDSVVVIKLTSML